MRVRWLFFVAGAVLIVAAAVLAFDRYRGDQREAEVDAIVAALRIGPGSRVADIGAGSGAYTVAIGRRLVPAGYIYATEIDPENLAAIRRAVAEAGLDNVTTIESRATETGLPPGCCDAVFLRTVYHHLTEPEPFVADLFDAVRPGGRLAIIDFPPGWLLSIVSAVEGVPADRGGHGIPPVVVIDELTTTGFVLEERIDDWGGGNYALVFGRP